MLQMMVRKQGEKEMEGEDEDDDDDDYWSMGHDLSEIYIQPRRLHQTSKSTWNLEVYIKPRNPHSTSNPTPYPI